MADPSRLGPEDWFAAVVAGLLAGIGGAMAWFAKSKGVIMVRLDIQEALTHEHDARLTAKHFSHETQLAVIHTNQDHMSHRLDEIRGVTQHTHQKVEELSQALTDVLIALRKS